jgi:hypothetical protein
MRRAGEIVMTDVTTKVRKHWLVTAIGAMFLVAMPSAAPAQANTWSTTVAMPNVVIYNNVTATTVQVFVTVCVNPTAQVAEVHMGSIFLLNYIAQGQCASASASVPASTAISVKPNAAGAVSAGTYSIAVK